MNEPIDKQISDLYRDASQEQPPAHLDDAILAAAKREVRAGPKSLSPFSTKWTLPFSLAAVIVLSVSVVTLVQKESPREIASGIASVNKAAEDASFLDESVPTEKQLKQSTLARRKMEAKSPPPETERRVTSAPKTAPAPAEHTATRQRMAESPALQLNLSSNVQTETDTADASAASAPKPSMDTVLADQQTKSEAKHLQKPANEETLAATAAADASTSEPAEASASLSIPMDQSRKASRTQALGFSQSKSQTTHTQSEMAAAAQPSAASEIDSPQSIMPQAVISASEPTSAPSCASLSTRDCLQSSHCTYELKSESDIAGNRYTCRNAVDQCERNFQQLTDTQQSCESKPGCRFIPGHCECAQGMPCDCRNENPPQCTSDKQSSDDERN